MTTTSDLVTLVSVFLLGMACALPVAGILRVRARIREKIGGPGGVPRLDDDAIRTIERTGAFRTDEDEPLDLGEIEAEEERFWREEDWDEAQEW